MGEINLDGVSFTAGSTVLLEPTSLSFQPGSVTAILGPNGAGKTTLLKIAAGSLQPRTGVVLYDDRPVTTYTPRALAMRRGMLAQHVDLAFAIAVRELVMMGRYPHFGRAPRPADHAIVDQALALVGMGDKADRAYQTLSGGEQQKVQLARVLAQIWSDDDRAPPRTLYLDEPIASIDVRYQLHILALARLFAQRNCSVVMTLHDLNLAALAADRLVLMRAGAIVDIVPGGASLDADLVDRVFGVRATRLEDAHGRSALMFSL